MMDARKDAIGQVHGASERGIGNQDILRSDDQRFSRIGHRFSKMMTDISEVDM
jgi:hypothetical protein